MMPHLTRRRSRSTSNPLPNKSRKLNTTTVVLGDISNGLRIQVIGDPSSITPRDVYNAAIDTLGASNSYDLAELKVEIEGGQEIVVATLKEGGSIERSTKRKELLSEMLDKQHLRMMQRDLIAWEIQIASLRKLLKKYEIELATSKEIQQFEVFETLLRALNDKIFNPSPTPEQMNHRGSSILSPVDIESLKTKNKKYITDILKWVPSSQENILLKVKALSCLKEWQQGLANVLMTPAIRNLNRMERNKIQHPRTSRQFAKAVVQQVYKDLNLGITHPGLTLAHFNNVIDHGPNPLGGSDSRPLFLEEDPTDSPLQLREEIEVLEVQIKALARIIEDTTEDVKRLTT